MNLTFINFLLIFIALGGIEGLEDLKWDKTRISVKQGDSVNVTCHTPIKKFLDVMRVSLTTHQGTRYTISDGKDVKEPFVRMKHLKVLYEVYGENAARVTIMYNGIRGEDGGMLRCSKLASPDSFVDVHIHVSVPMKSVIWSADPMPCTPLTPLALGALYMRQMKECSITCSAVIEGSGFPIVMRVLVDGEEDITRFFTETQESKSLPSEDGYEKLTSMSRLTYITLNPNHEFNRYNLTCLAWGDSSNQTDASFPSLSASAVLIIESGPMLTCEKYEHQADLHSNLTIDCTLTSNPKSEVNWSAQSRLGQEPRVQLREKQLDTDTWQVNLVMTDIDEFHFTDFHLTAVNDVSSQEVTIVVRPLVGSFPSAVGDGFRANILEQKPMAVISGNEKLIPSLAGQERQLGSGGASYSLFSLVSLLLLSLIFCIVLH